MRSGASRLARRSGITAPMSRAPQGLSGTGCAWCVRVNEARFQQALGVLRRSGASFRQLFREEEDGQVFGGGGMIYLDSAATSLLKPRSVPAAVLGAHAERQAQAGAGTSPRCWLPKLLMTAAACWPSCFLPPGLRT